MNFSFERHPIKAGKFTLATSVALAVLAVPQASHGANATWTGLGADSVWTTTANWTASPVPGAGDTATFNGSGNGRTTITTAPASLTRYLFASGSAAYTISGSSTTWSVPNGGGVSINSGVTTNQDLSGIQYLRPDVNATIEFVNQGSGTLRLGTIFTQNAGSGTTQTALRFAPGLSGTIEIASGRLIDNAGTGGAKKISVLLDDVGVLNMAAAGSFDGTDAEGNSVTIRRGTYRAGTIGVIGTARTSLGANGRIQFGQTGQTYAATLDYYTAANATTDRSFYVIDNNTAIFNVSGGSSTNLTITSAITQSGSAAGGGKLVKDGVGALTLSGANTHTGTTTITAGTLRVNGSLAAASAVSVGSGATLGGSGTIGGPTSILGGGILAPGNSPGTLTVNNTLDLADTSILAFEINPTDQTIGGGINDLVTGVTDLTLGGTLNLSGSGSFTSVTPGTIWRLFNYTGSLTLGTLTIGTAPTLADGNSFDVDTSTGGQVNLVVVPEPGSLLLVTLGLAAAGWLRVRQASGLARISRFPRASDEP